jgi:hypothetical protein
MRLQQRRGVEWRFVTAVVHREKCEVDEGPVQPVSSTGRINSLSSATSTQNRGDGPEEDHFDQLLCGVKP